MNIGQESPGSMQELKQERWDEAELLRDSRILEHTHSFIVEYNFKTKQCYIDPAQKRHVYGDWAGWAKDKRRDYSRIALKEDIPKLQALFDFDGLKAGDSKSAAVRLYVKPHTYEWFRVSLICYGEQDGDCLLYTSDAADD